MSVWQPIATAPKDGTPVLILLDGFNVYLARYGYVADWPQTPENAVWSALDFDECEVCVGEGEGAPLCWAEPPAMTFQILDDIIEGMKRTQAARESKIG